MVSLLTNSAASATLRQMSATQRDMQQAQGQASSGLRVGAASDNPAYWAIGVTMRSQVGALAAVNDGLALSSSIAAVTTNALTTIVSQMDGIKADLVAAAQPGISASDVELDVAARQQQIATIASAASFNGQNWLVAQQVTDETVHDTATYDQSRAQVQNVLNRTVVATASFNETDASTGDYQRTGGNGVAQTTSTSSTRTDTYTTTVTTSSGVTTKHLGISHGMSASTSPVTLATASSDISLLESYRPGAGLGVATISDSPFRLFTNNTGKVTETSVSSFTDQSVDNNLVDYGTSEHLLSTSQAASYNASSADPATGLMDRSLSVTNATNGRKATILNMTTIGATSSDLAAMLHATDTALTSLISATAFVGGLANRIGGQRGFNAALSDALTSGIGSLTDADMSTTATRIQALQTQQQLQTQALNIANESTQIVLKLFQ